eukprot:2346195-Pyramimonas_sp.AAC.1
MEPQELSASWWPRSIGGAVIAPPQPTCNGRKYDNFVISASLAALGPQVEALRPTTTRRACQCAPPSRSWAPWR